MRIRVLVATLAIAIIGTTGCMEEPSPVGARLLPEVDIVKVDTDTIGTLGNSYARKFPAFRDPTRILLGNAGFIDTEAWAWLKFSPLPDTLIGVTLLEASINLKGAYALGTTSEQLSYDLHKGLKNWFVDTTNVDSLSLDAIQPGSYYESVGRPGLLPVQHDTTGFSIRLDTSLVREWLTAITDSTKSNFGVVLKPTNTNLIRGFRSFRDIDPANAPQLVIVFQRASGARDTARISRGEDRFLARVRSDAWMSDSTTVRIRNGISYRGVLDFKNVVLEKNYAVHRALLEVTLKDSTALNDYTTHSLYAYFMTESGVVENLLSPSEVGTSNGQKVYRFIVSNFVHFWGRGVPVRTIAIGGATEQNTIDVFALHGPGSSNIAARPKLIITYTEFR